MRTAVVAVVVVAVLAVAVLATARVAAWAQPTVATYHARVASY